MKFNFFSKGQDLRLKEQSYNFPTGRGNYYWKNGFQLTLKITLNALTYHACLPGTCLLLLAYTEY